MLKLPPDRVKLDKETGMRLVMLRKKYQEELNIDIPYSKIVGSLIKTKELHIGLPLGNNGKGKKKRKRCSF